MSYLAEMKFTAHFENESSEEALLFFSRKLTASSLIGQFERHSSSHYVNDIYYKWSIEKLDIKLYWDDEEDNKFIVEVMSFEQDVTSVSNKLFYIFSNLPEVQGLNLSFFNES